MTELQKKIILNMRKNGEGYKTIATAVGLSRDAVRTFCKTRNMTGFGSVAALNVDERIQNGELCPNCCEPIKQPSKGRHKKFCSEECRRDWWKKHPEKTERKETAQYKLKCTYCGKDFVSYGNKNRKYCSHYCYIHDRFYEREDNQE